MIDIVLYGAGGYGKEVLGILKDYNKKAKKFKISGDDVIDAVEDEEGPRVVGG